MHVATTSERTGHVGHPKLLMAALVVVPMLSVSVSVVLLKDVFIGVLIASAGAMILTILSRPASATLFFFFLTDVNAPVVAVHFHGMPAAMAAATVGLLLIQVWQHLIVERKPLLVDPVLPWLLAFCALQLVSALFAGDKINALQAVFVYMTEGLVLFILTTNAVRTPDTLRLVTWVLIAAGVFMGGLVVFQKVSDTYWRDYKGFAQVSDPDLNAYGEHEGGRWPSGPIGDKNYFAQFMLMLAPLALFRFWNETASAFRMAGLVATIVILAGVGLTGSRGAAIGFAAILFVMIVLRYVTIRQVITVVAVGGLLVLIMPEYRQRVASIVSVVSVVRGEDVRGTDTAVQGRLTEMAAAALVFQEHPLLGVGPGNFPAHFVEKADSLGFTVHGVERRAHCLYLEIAAELGIPGLFLFLVILAITIKHLLAAHAVTRSRQMESLTASYLLAVIAMMATGVFLSFAYHRYSWLIIGLASAAARVAIEHSGASSDESGSLPDEPCQEVRP